MEVVCSFPNETGFRVGELLIMVLRGHVVRQDCEELDSEDASPVQPDCSLVAFAQVHGHMYVDKKWDKGTATLSDIVVESDEGLPIDHPHNLPADPSRSDSICLLTTARVALSPTHLADAGVVIESMVPRCALPSCRGRVMSISYFLTVSLQSASWAKTMHFPFTVHGHGSSAPTISRQYVGLVAYPLSCLPRELFSEPILSYSSEYVTSRGSSPQPLKLASQSYKVSDRGHICNAHVTGSRLVLGGTVKIELDFTNSEQACTAVRALLMMEERRADPERTLIQEKVLASAVKYTEDAVTVSMCIPLPSDVCCSADLPICQIGYRLLLEYHLLKEESTTGTDLFSFSAPLHVTAFHTTFEADMSEGEGGMNKNQMINLCLDSSVARRPIRDSLLGLR